MSKPFVCPLCSVGFSSANNLKRHKDLQHGRPYKYKCLLCPKRCNTSSNLRRHERNVHSRKTYKCISCGVELSSAYFLNRHIKTEHDRSKSYNCSICSVNFTSENSLKMHYEIVHQNFNIQQCSVCQTQFSTMANLKRHVREIHESANSEECSICRRTFTNSQSLRRHQICTHPVEFYSEEYFECHYCALRFGRKDSLISHIKLKHSELYLLEPQFICYICNKGFPVKKKLLAHQMRVHRAKRKDNCNVKCVLCSEVRTWKADLLQHYTDEHNIVFEYEYLLFNKFDEFEAWKYKMERSTVSQFNRISYTERRTKCSSIFVYTCHRSGVLSSKADERKRMMKEQGSKKVNGVCPAEIRVTVNNEGMCEVTFRKTHLGHSLTSEEEMQHVYLNSDERRIIASKIAAGIPFEKILEETRVSDAPFQEYGISKLNLLTRHDLSNIAASFNVKRTRRIPFGDNPLDVDEFVRENVDSVLFYKPSNACDDTFGVFEEEDFVLVIMTDIQEKLLRMHGHKLIALDGTKGVIGYDFVLHSVLVSDDTGLGIAVAFALSSRNNQNVIDVLLLCLRNQVGIIETTTLISDMENSHYDSWIQIMGPPKHRVYSTWHVRDNWRRKLVKISDADKRTMITKKLVEMSEEIDETIFKRKLEDFISNTDPHLKTFLDSFRKQYLHHTECWAYCYRVSAGINTDMDLKSFHSLIKYSLGLEGIRKIKRLVDCLDVLHNYLALGENDFKFDNSRKLNKKLCTLMQRHESAVQRVKHPESLPVERVGEDKWRVGFFTQSDVNIIEMHVVEKISPAYHAENENECELVCKKCNVCSHVYTCSCTDYCVHGNMCEHIHSLSIFLKYIDDNFPADSCVPLLMSCLSEEDSNTVEQVEVDVSDEGTTEYLENDVPFCEIIHEHTPEVVNVDSYSTAVHVETADFSSYDFDEEEKDKFMLVGFTAISDVETDEEIELVTLNNVDFSLTS